MAKVFKKGLSVFLAAMLCVSAMNMLAMAAEGETKFTAMELENIVPGSDGYNYMIAQDLEDGVYYYETSNHTLKIANAGAVHIFPLIDTTRDAEDGVWESGGLYVSGKSNYDVVYCCDFSTGTRVDEEDVTNTYYKRVNLEDSEYFSDELAERLRAIVSVSYPANSVEEAKAALQAAGFERAEELDRSELISATQGAIWRLVNADSIIEGTTDFTYRATVKTARKAGWGGYMHDYSAEPMNFTDGKKDATITEIGDRITDLQEFFLNSKNKEFLANGKAENGKIVISNLSITGAENAGSDLYTFDVNVKLNQGADGDDEIALYVYVDGELCGKPVQVGEDTDYTVSLKAKADADVKVVVSGVQKLEKGVYFYAPAPQDIDGDGIATSREVSQNLIGAGTGETDVYAEAEIKFNNVTFKSGTVSNISYMFINKETKEVSFLKKIDVPENATSAPIITMDGYVSAMFMKQSTSGMFWFSEEVDEETQQAVVECLKDNNPSYKGHWDEFAFGDCEFTWAFKKNKYVTYDFQTDVVVFSDTVEEPVDEEPVVEEPVEEEPVVEEPVVEEPAEENNKKNNGNNKNKDKKNKNK